jgi:Animal haem peroxidase
MSVDAKKRLKSNVSRRQFLKKLGTGAVAVWASGAMPIRFAESAQPPDTTLPGHFGRMFRLPPFAPPTDAIREALLELGKADGIMDATDDLAADPEALIVDPALNLVNRNNPNHTAGVTFMGQFLDHDMTFDTRSRLGFPTQPVRSPNARTPFFDLDSVYAGGPGETPELYGVVDDPIKFRVENGGQFEDLPRNPTNNAALLGDPRNDENLIIAGLHAAFLLFHNNAVDLLRLQNPLITDDEVFFQARRLTIWHNQWMILHEFLPLFVGQPMVDTVLSEGRRFYNPRREAFIPVEFQITYRFGHSMVRPSYRANLAGDNGEPFFGMIFDPAGAGSEDPVDLRGGARAPRRFIGWQTFFDFGGVFSSAVRPNKRIDTKISTPLFHLPLGTIPAGTPPVSLMQRNLMRHLTWQLPSGQAIAREMGAHELNSADLVELKGIASSFAESTPLLYYILKEAQLVEDGLRLGPVGGRIVSEVFVGLLELDPSSYLNLQPDWVPTLPTQRGTPESFRMVDFLTFAEVDPASRGQ